MSADQGISRPEPPADDKAIAAIIRNVTEARHQPLLHEALDIITAVGLRVPEYRTIKQLEQTSAALSGLPGPYAVKVIAERVSHKSDQGGVKLGLSDSPAVHAAVSEMMKSFGSSPDAGLYGVLVQRMAARSPGSLELIVGGKRDPNFGPVVLLGHGGIFVEAFGQTSLRTAPLSTGEIDEMIEELPGSEIFKGLRGQPPIDREALKDAILRVAYLMVHFPEIDSIDINPLLVSSSGVQAIDARIFLSN